MQEREAYETNTDIITDLSHASVVPDHEVSLNGLHQGQRVNLDRSAPPLPQVGALWMPLQLALELVGVEELECLGTPGASGRPPGAGEVVNFDRKLLQVADATVDLVDEGSEGCALGDLQ